MSLQPKLTRRPPSFTRPVGPTDRPTLFFLSLSLSLSLSHFGRILFSAPQPSKDTDLTYRAFITSVDDDDRSRLRLEAEQKNVLSLSSVAAKRWPLYFLLLFFLSFFFLSCFFFFPPDALLPLDGRNQLPRPWRWKVASIDTPYFLPLSDCPRFSFHLPLPWNGGAVREVRLGEKKN